MKKETCFFVYPSRRPKQYNVSRNTLKKSGELHVVLNVAHSEIPLVYITCSLHCVTDWFSLPHFEFESECDVNNFRANLASETSNI